MLPQAKNRLLISTAALATAIAAASAIAQAPPAGTYDLNQLPETKGVVKQYVLSPRGDVDGLILQDGTEVNFPPHLGIQIVYAVKPGDAVSIRGLRARMTPLVDAALIRNDASGATIMDAGPNPQRDETATFIDSKVSQLLYGKRGEVNGALLDDGTLMRLPPHEAVRLNSILAAGKPLAVSGVMISTPFGKVIDARSIGATPSSMNELDRSPPPPPGPKDGPLGDRG